MIVPALNYVLVWPMFPSVRLQQLEASVELDPPSPLFSAVLLTDKWMEIVTLDCRARVNFDNRFCLRHWRNFTWGFWTGLKWGTAVVCTFTNPRTTVLNSRKCCWFVLLLPIYQRYAKHKRASKHHEGLACKIRSACTNCNNILSPSSGSESSYTNKVDSRLS